MSGFQASGSHILFCVPEKEHFNNDQGLFRPLFKETANGLVLVDIDDYPNNGFIHVTTGYEKAISICKPGQIFRAEVSVSHSWEGRSTSDEGGHMSKFVTYDRLISVAEYLKVSMLIDGNYPEPGTQRGLACFSRKQPTDGFFIRCLKANGERIIIGPLDVVHESIKEEDGGFEFNYRATSRPFKGGWRRINDVAHSALVFDEELVPESLIVSIYNQEYVINNKQLPFLSAKHIDLSTDEQLLKWASKGLRNTNPAPEHDFNFGALKKAVEQLPSQESLPDDILDIKKSRLKSLPEKFQKMDDFGLIISNYLGSDDGQNILKQHVNTHKDSLLKAHLESELKGVEAEARRSIDEGNSELHEIKDEIRDLEKKREKLKASPLGQEIDTLKNEVEILRDEKKIIQGVTELQSRKTVLEDDIQDLNLKRNKATELLEEIQRKINQSQETHKLNLIELKLGLDALSGNVSKEDLDEQSKIDCSGEFFDTYKTDENSDFNLDDDRNFVLDSIYLDLKTRGRHVEKQDVAVILTCMIQNLITILAGQPGSGKTSFVKEISRSLGLEAHGKHVHIQVQRGWSSDRDILGFHNKLTQRYDPDHFGLYKLIKGMQVVEPEHELCLVLLDEANLSPIEHYWSGFMGACDDRNNFSIQGEKLNLPEGLRFMATVNHDRTTEPLSARLLDRSPVIYVSSKASNIDVSVSDSFEEVNSLRMQFPYGYLKRVFGNSESAELTRDESRILDHILEHFTFLQIEYRKKKSILSFTSTIRSLLSVGGVGSLKGFDVALLVHVLPLIGGQGVIYAKGVKDFHQYLQTQGLVESYDRLSLIIEKSQYDTYSYFS